MRKEPNPHPSQEAIDNRPEPPPAPPQNSHMIWQNSEGALIIIKYIAKVSAVEEEFGTINGKRVVYEDRKPRWYFMIYTIAQFGKICCFYSTKKEAEKAKNKLIEMLKQYYTVYVDCDSAKFH